MNAIQSAWRRIVASPRSLVVVVGTTILAVAAGIGLAFAVGGVRDAGVADQPTASAAVLSPVPTLEPSASPTASPTATPMPTLTANPTASPSPTPTPTASPTPSPTPRATSIPTVTPAPVPPLPGECGSFVFEPRAITVSSLPELQAGIIGQWAGCVTTPWVAPYQVAITFRADGTYSGVAEGGASDELPAFYYGSDADSPEKRYELNDLQDDLEGAGQIDIWFWEGNTNRGDLRNIRLMGDALSFEFFHRGQYGPLTYELYRVVDGN